MAPRGQERKVNHMKKLSKVLVLVLSAVMVLAMSASVFAEDEVTPNGKITLNNAVVGEEYTLYKVFDAKVKEGRVDGGEGISYSSTWLTTSNDYFDVDAKGNITIKDAGKSSDGKLSTNAIAWLKSQIGNFGKIGDPKTATSTTVEWASLADGYYFINTTTGSFVTVDSITPNVTVEDKNTLPTGDKKQSATANGTYADTLLDLNVGDTVYYQYEITNGKGSDKDIIITDTMTDGLDLQATITVQKGGNDLVKDTDYTLTTSDHGFVLTLKANYVKALAEGEKVIVKYSAKLNASAVVNSTTGNSNEAALKYSNQEAVTDTVYVATYDFIVKKTDGTNFLPGAGFKLYDAKTGGNLVAVAKDETGYYKDAADTEIMVENAEGANVRGLAPGKYYLEETTTPDGFNTLTERQEVEVAAGQESAPVVTVVNQSGAELPTTGGIGTTIFYIIGSALVIGCGIVLISRKRMQKK